MEVVTALSSEDAMRRFNRSNFGRVITDMGQQEGRQFNPQAGFELTRQMRSIDNRIPIIEYTSPRSARTFWEITICARASNVTNSPTELSNLIQNGAIF